MPKKLVIINGNINAGKSTISKLLIDKFKPAIHVEADLLHNFLPGVEGDRKYEPTVLLSSLIVGNLLEQGFNVILAYPLNLQDYAVIVEAVRDREAEIYSFTLNPSRQILLSTRHNRVLTDWEKNRISTILVETPEWGVTIDNTHQTSEETFLEILKKIDEQIGRCEKKC